MDLKADDDLKKIRTESDALGMVHDKYQQYYKNVKVEGALISAHSKSGIIGLISGTQIKIEDLDVIPSVTAYAAFDQALNHVKAKVYAWEGSVKKGFPGYELPTGELVILADASMGIDPVLAYKFDIYAAQPLYRAWVFIDAKTGAYLKEEKRIHESNITATANTLYDGSQTITADYTGSLYRLRQTASGGGIQTFSLNNSTSYTSATDINSSTTTFSSDPTSNQAHYGAEKTHAYYLTRHNRNSYNNAGAIIKSYTHYSSNYVNAFWDGTRMTYGDGNGTTNSALVSLDICGHEISHGVTEYSANLNYSNESGALNESFSDIFGECVENFSKGSNDWLMGREIGINRNGAFRSMANPKLYGDPDTYKGTNWYTGTGDNGGVHTNSGVQNKWFYILAAGASGTNDLGNSYSVTGLGMENASRIAYRNLTVYLSPTSNYAAARAGAIQSATDLFGAGSAEVIATTNAWYAVGVGCSYGGSCYCNSFANSGASMYVKTVTIGNFTNSSGAAGYSNFTASPANLGTGSLAVSLVPGFRASAYNMYWRIWIDLNNNGNFDDAGELVFSGGPSNSTVNGNLVIPNTASGSRRMRVSMKYNGAPTSCENFSSGEVEDYTVTFINTHDTEAPTAPVLSSTGSTASSISLSWTASTDNVGVTGYEVVVNGIYNGTTTGTSYTINGLNASTTYPVYVRAKDAAGNSAASNTITPSTTSNTSITLFGHYFESGYDGWVKGGGDCTRYKGSRSYEGQYSIQIRDNSGIASAITSAAWNVSSYNQLLLDFYFYSAGMENGEDFLVQYYNGSSWQTVATFAAGTHFNNNGFYHATATINSGGFPANAQFRFQCDASDNSDLIYIDAVILKGNVVVSPGGSNTQTCSLVSFLNTDEEESITGKMNEVISIFPNPAASVLRISSPDKILGAEIIQADGKAAGVEIFRNNQVDVEQLQPGIYFIRIKTVKNTVVKRFIKL